MGWAAARRTRLAALLVAVAVAALVPTAALGAGAPAVPTGLHAVDITSTGFTVTIDHHANTAKYRVYVSTLKSNLYVDNIAGRTSFGSTKPSLKVTGLAYKTVPYYYRVKSINGSSHRWSEIRSVSLRPATPTAVTVTTGATGTWLTWSAGSATGFQIARATDATLTQGRVVFTSRSRVHQFSPYPLAAGSTYWFAVRALNGSTWSSWSPTVSALAGNSLDGIRVMSYNILNTKRDGTKAGDGTIGSWSKRAPGVVALIRAGDPDVIAFQEGGGWVGDATDKTRQVDDIARRLGGDYQLVRTEVPPTEPNYFRTGSYVMIKRATIATVGPGDHWMIGGASRVGAHVELESKESGGRFLFVATHLTASWSTDPDAERGAEMQRLVDLASAEAASLGGIPVVYGGDFNSHPTATDPNDAVTVVARAARLSDGVTAARTLVDTRYNSGNKYLRRPPASSVSVDHVYASPGVTVVSFQVLVKLVKGEFSGTIPSDHNPVVAAIQIPY